jgi:hypothetical protein
MSSDKKQINEGYEKKGGQNPQPSTPKPNYNPPPQKPSQTKKD